MVKVLERPAVVPGFLTGPDWPTAIDVRTVPRGEQLENMDVEQRTDLWGEPHPAEIVLWRRRLTQYEMLEHQPFVTAITRQRVVVRRAQMLWGIAPPSTTEKSDRITWAKSSAGIQTMREELERQLGDQQDEQERWIQALTNWASGGPAAGGR